MKQIKKSSVSEGKIKINKVIVKSASETEFLNLIPAHALR
jgi:hypothetical protein